MAFSVLITGSSGYVGSHLVKFFKKNGANVFGIDLEFPPRILQRYLDSHIVADISNQNLVAEFLRNHSPEIVIHCAGKCLVEESVRLPQMYRDFNVVKATSFLETCINSNIKKFLFSSTAATYGQVLKTPIDESHPQNPINPYGETKLEFEKILLNLEQKNNLLVGIARYFNVAGADPDSEIGEAHDPETHLIPNLIRSMANNEPVVIYGNDYATPDGTCIRDYIHVWDLADFHWRLASKMIENSQGGIYNLGTSKGFSILEVIEAAERILAKPATKNFLPPRPGDPAILVADPSKAMRELQWQFPLSNPASIIESAHRWHQKS